MCHYNENLPATNTYQYGKFDQNWCTSFLDIGEHPTDIYVLF